jgi:hypothetical protein
MASQAAAGVPEPPLGDLRVGSASGSGSEGKAGFLLEGSLASSIDGDVFVSMSFNPVVDTATRWR